MNGKYTEGKGQWGRPYPIMSKKHPTRPSLHWMYHVQKSGGWGKDQKKITQKFLRRAENGIVSFSTKKPAVVAPKRRQSRSRKRLGLIASVPFLPNPIRIHSHCMANFMASRRRSVRTPCLMAVCRPPCPYRAVCVFRLNLALVIGCHTRELLGWHLSRSSKPGTARYFQERKTKFFIPFY